MRFKSVFILIFALILTCGVSFAADSFTVGNHSFDIPDGYDVDKISDNSSVLTLKNNTNYSIFVNAGDVVDFETGKISRQTAGFTLMGEENFTTDNDVAVDQQNYIKNESFFSFYTFDVDDESYEIGYSFPVHDDELNGEDNPVISIIESITK